MKEPLPGLTEMEGNEAIAHVWNEFVDSRKSHYDRDLGLRMFVDEPSGKIFRWTQYANDGDQPENGRSLWILMYGCTIPNKASEEIKLNESGAIWLIPHCSTDWQQEYIDTMLDRVIEHHILVNEVQPNRIFLLGMSPSGNEGVYQLASRMPDRWAAAGVTGGNPSTISPLSLRNLPFALFMSERMNTDANKRSATNWAQSLEQCSQEHYSGGYHYWIKIGYDEEQKQDALAWMNKHSRNAWPTRIIWQHSGWKSQKRFYWLSLSFTEIIPKGQMIIAEVRNRKNIYLEQIPDETQVLIIRLSDTLVNLNRPINVYIYKQASTTRIFHGLIPRTRLAIEKSIEERADPMSAATALLHIIWVRLPFSGFIHPLIHWFFLEYRSINDLLSSIG